MFGGFSSILISLSALTANAQGTSEKVKVETPGTLVELVSELESSRIYSLKIEGALNAADLSYIGESAGKISTVKELDLSDITLVSGPAAYKTYKLRDNENGLLGNTTATFFISDTARIESKRVDIALGGQSTLQNVYGKNLAGLFAGCGYEKIVLPKYLTSLGYASFFEADGIQDVVFPSSVDEIEADAFYSASTLTQVTLPPSLKKIGSDSFSKTGLTNVELPASLDSIYGRAFRDTPVTTIDLKNVKYIGNECFVGCQLEGILNVSNLRVVKEKAFSGNAISGITFGNELKEIEKEAFYSNKKLTSLVLPDGLEIIGERAFSFCKNLVDVEIPNTIQNIGYEAFDLTPWNDNLKGDNGVVYIGTLAYAYDYDSASDPTILEFREGTTIVSSSFSIESKSDGYGNYYYPEKDITTIKFPSTLRIIEDGGKFEGMTKLGDLVLNEGLEYIGERTFSGCANMWIEKFPSSLKYIGKEAFNRCDGLTEITISDNIEYLGYRAFGGCKGLSMIRYNSNIDYSDVTEEWYKGNVFNECDGLYNIIIGQNVNYIAPNMFADTGVRKVTFENADSRTGKLTLGKSCFNGCANLTEIVLPTIKSIGRGSFNGSGLIMLSINGECDEIEGGDPLCRSIESVKINGRISKVGENVFNGSALNTFEALSCDSIGDSAFTRCQLQNFNIAEGPVVFGNEAFYYCDSLKSISINDYSKLGQSMFEQCKYLEEVNLGIGIVEIPNNTFYNCFSLSSFNSESKIETVGIGAFRQTSLSSFDFENIKSIGGSAFSNVNFSDMPELYLPDGFKDLGADAFYRTNFSSVSLPVSLLSIPQLAFKDAKGRFELKWRIPQGYKYEGDDYNIIANGAFASSLSNYDIIIPEGVSEISYVAFYNNNLRTISLPSTLKVLLANALQNGEGGTVEKIYCHAKTPPSVNTYGLLANWVDDIFKGIIYVPASSVDSYEEDSFWGKYNIQALPIEVESISLDTESIDLAPGETHQLTANINPSNAADKSLTWKTSDESVATVSENGLITALKVGSAVITVSSSNGITASCTVNIEERIIEVAEVSLDRSWLELTVGDNATLSATVNPSDATDKTLTWTSSDESVVTVSEYGLVNAIQVGSAVITVSSSNGITAKCNVTVKDKDIEVAEIMLDRSELILLEGESEVLSATINPSDATDKTLSWTSSDNSVAKVSTDGLVTAIKAGKTVITVSSSNGITASCSVIVESKVVDVTGITLDRSELVLTEGETEMLSATVNPSDATDKTLEWTSSDESVAMVSAYGVVTAIKEGTAVITVSSSNGVYTTCKVTVEAKIIEMEAIKLNAEDLALEIGDSYQLIAEVVPADATYQELEWWSDNDNVASVDQTGLVTMIGEGMAIIHVKSVNCPEIEATCSVNVTTDVYGLIENSAPCDIYTTTGKLLKKNVDVSEVDRLIPGIYIICQNGKATKIIK